jgi:hypothetical protein
MSFPTYEEVLILKNDTTIKNIWVCNLEDFLKKYLVDL